MPETLANSLVQMYRHEAESGWVWFEPYPTVIHDAGAGAITRNRRGVIPTKVRDDPSYKPSIATSTSVN
ncbi:MAG: hypothetical protein LH618_09550 [Saprospiraceae bacterium]|nr:hypothetical protein [Saprospiraceae bacterium]